jgi:hypothetical protein
MQFRFDEVRRHEQLDRVARRDPAAQLRLSRLSKELVDGRGIEPLTSALRTQRSPS